MRNESLVEDYIKRAGSRIRAIGVLMEDESFADVVRESQEVVEICLKALLRHYRIEVPRIHDVSPVLDQNRMTFEPWLQDRVDELREISKQLRRDRELAFYGSEDLTPSQFYTREDAQLAFNQAQRVHATVKQAVF